MKIAFRIKLSTYRRLIKNGHTFEKMRKLDFRASFDGASFDGASFDGASFNGASFDGASFYGASFNRASFDRASFYGASLHVIGIGMQLKIGKYTATFVGRYLSVGCVQHTIKKWMKAPEAEYNKHPEGMKYRETIQRTIRSVFALRKTARLPKV